MHGHEELIDVIAWTHSRRCTATTVALAVGLIDEEKPSHARDLDHPWIVLAANTPCKYNAS